MDAIKGDPDVLAKLGVGRHRAKRRWLLRSVVLLVLIAAGIGVWQWRVRANRNKGDRQGYGQPETGRHPHLSA